VRAHAHTDPTHVGRARVRACARACVRACVPPPVSQVVCDFCRAHLPHNTAAFESPKLELINDDARAQLEQYPGKFDVIIGDLADPLDGGPCYQLYTQARAPCSGRCRGRSARQRPGQPGSGGGATAAHAPCAAHGAAPC
jgi:hypothetical protein